MGLLGLHLVALDFGDNFVHDPTRIGGEDRKTGDAGDSRRREPGTRSGCKEGRDRRDGRDEMRQMRTGIFLSCKEYVT